MPAGDGGFVAPVHQLRHRFAVRAGDHVLLDGCFGLPHTGGPEDVAGFAQELNAAIAGRTLRLALRLDGVEGERGHEAPGTDTETCDGNDGHAGSVSSPFGQNCKQKLVL